MVNSKTLSGIVTWPGKGEGIAVLAVHGKTSDMPKTGTYVLVADSLTSNLDNLITNAKALVTDSEDFDSYASTISRENNIPCIISTRYATKRINPGDLIQVNADKNIVTWNRNTSNCVFCEKHPVVFVLSTKFFYAIYDGYPVREGHLLVIPFRHIQFLVDLTRDEFLDLYSMLGLVDQLISKTFNADGYNLGLNDGPAAGQTIPHLHFHIVPRKHGDVPNPRGGIRNFLPNPLVEYPTD